MTNNYNWDPYVLIKNDEVFEFWKNFLTANHSNKTLFILAKGFDPRMNSFIQAIQDILNESASFMILDIEGDNSPYKKYTDHNWKILNELLLNKKINFTTHNLEMWQSKQNSKTRVGPYKVIDLVTDEHLADYANIVIDISSMPRAIYFSLITSILNYSKDKKAGNNPVNVLINVVENPFIDENIISHDVDDNAAFIPHLGGNFMMTANLSDIEGIQPKVWIPILGEKQKAKLLKIKEFVNPEEICPILPFPSVKPRRTDDLILEYREVLFDNWLVEKENLIYASESNPFELYRHLVKTCSRYIAALKPIGDCKIAISSLSSKLLSIGALMATYEMYRIKEESVGLVHVGGSRYNIDENILNNYPKIDENLITLWLDGEPYV